MKRFATMLAAVGLFATTSLGGVIQFDPAVIEVDINNLPASVDVVLTVQDVSLPDGVFESIDMQFVSESLGFEALEWTPAFVNGTLFRQAFDVPGFAGGFSLAGFESPFVLGTMTLSLPQTAGAIDVGTEWIYALDSGSSSVGQGVSSEPLTGMGSVVVVPEPATLMLLGLGAVGLVRRRFA